MSAECNSAIHYGAPLFRRRQCRNTRLILPTVVSAECNSAIHYAAPLFRRRQCRNARLLLPTV